MPSKPHTLAHYQTLIDQCAPSAPPTARLVYPETPSRRPHIHLGILDASFNPMTRAHEALLHTAQKSLNLDAMLLMLSAANVDKDLFGANLAQRLAMLVAYAQNHPNLSVAICSHARFVDKTVALKTCYPATTQFYFIVGYDTLVRLFDPKYYTHMQKELETLFASCRFIAANRGANDAQSLTDFLQKRAVAPFAQRIYPINLPEEMANISSTHVRNRLQAHQPVDHLVPSEILQAIQDHNLYAKQP